ncbi:hypothetical protein MAPG_07214 [Magnaporthiopsis poae ATCC 64411]|uniref:Isotrichodermin C-15 hydroxylase n=1 Tax=Magnaporthiopsis poae (strain ATCC 64411 / 73-15) TaxID=644358 RepID=A0A0C4E426_MAGP6|nr:hypothetical protein MAPG_07214 [Magnaporthiopsis poae ATCC 64411]
MPSIDVQAGMLSGGARGLLTLPNMAIGLAAAVLVYSVGVCVYRIWFHPLSKYPGPLLLASSDLFYNFESYVTGSMARRAERLHRKYGKIVRIGPNRLAVDGAVAFPEIYAHKAGGDGTEFHKQIGFSFDGDAGCIIGAPNREEHRRHRRQLAHAFSEGALAAQESLLQHYVDLFIRRLAENAKDSKPVALMDWLNYLAFDIIGDLSLGESFGSLSSSNYHPWVRNMFQNFRGGALVRFWKSMGPLKALALLDTGGSIKTNKDNFNYAIEKARARMALGPNPVMNTKARTASADQMSGPRRDFFSYMMKKQGTETDGLTDRQLELNAFILITAGSETTSTALSVLFYLLSRRSNRTIRDAVAAEVRAAFSREADINLSVVGPNALPLLHACIEETLRFHPPAAEIPPRVSPGAVVDGKYIPKGTIVRVYASASFRNPDSFVDPLTFRPERFLPADHPMYNERYALGNARAYFKPFSHGPRDCIGKNLAYAEMRLVASRILLRFDIDEAEGTGDDWLDNQRTFTAWEKPQLWVTLHERKGLEIKG